MSTTSPSIQAILRFSLLSLSSWETCILSLIEMYQPSSVSFFCNSADQCPSDNVYKIIRYPSQTIFGLEPHQLPAFKDTDFVFWIDDDIIEWNNQTVWKYRFGGKNSFKIVAVANKASKKSMERLFKAMWKSGVVYAAVLLRNISSSQVFTYIPFKSGEKCEDTSPVLLGECKDSLETVFDMSNKILNLKNCTMRISIAHDKPWLQPWPFSGKLHSLLEEIKYRMNFSIESREPLIGRNGGMCGPLELTGSKGDVFTGKAHMAFGSFTRGECSVLAYVNIPHIMCYSWCTPVMSGSNYIFYFLIGILQPEVWISLIATSLVVSFSVWILSSVLKDETTSNDLIYIMLAIFATVPLVDYRTTSLRVIVVMWLFACLVIRSAYESELKSQSSVPLGTYVIEDLSELENTDLQLCSTAGNLQVLKAEEEDPIVKTLYSRTTICSGSMFDNIKSAGLKKDRAIFTADLRCSLSSSEIDSRESLVYPSTGGCALTNQVTTVVTLPGSPFKNRLQLIHNRCFDSGLWNKWLDVPPIVQEIGQLKAYSITPFLSPLFILLLGWMFGVIFFVAEIVCKKHLTGRKPIEEKAELFRYPWLN